MTETKETWSSALQSFKLQYEFCLERVNVYKHLLATQQEPGNVPKALQKWQQLARVSFDALEQHLERGQRWHFIEFTDVECKSV
jgi:hypothetical protein